MSVTSSKKPSLMCSLSAQDITRVPWGPLTFGLRARGTWCKKMKFSLEKWVKNSKS
jgi:hypothetical protein